MIPPWIAAKQEGYDPPTTENVRPRKRQKVHLDPPDPSLRVLSSPDLLAKIHSFITAGPLIPKGEFLSDVPMKRFQPLIPLALTSKKVYQAARSFLLEELDCYRITPLVEQALSLPSGSFVVAMKSTQASAKAMKLIMEDGKRLRSLLSEARDFFGVIRSSWIDKKLDSALVRDPMQRSLLLFLGTLHDLEYGWGEWWIYRQPLRGAIEKGHFFPTLEGLPAPAVQAAQSLVRDLVKGRAMAKQDALFLLNQISANQRWRAPLLSDNFDDEGNNLAFIAIDHFDNVSTKGTPIFTPKDFIKWISEDPSLKPLLLGVNKEGQNIVQVAVSDCVCLPKLEFLFQIGGMKSLFLATDQSGRNIRQIAEARKKQVAEEASIPVITSFRNNCWDEVLAWIDQNLYSSNVK